MVTTMEAVFGPIKVENWLGAQLSKICFYGIFITLLSQQVQIAPHKMVPSKYATINSPCVPVLFSMAHVFLLNFVRRPSYIQFTTPFE